MENVLLTAPETCFYIETLAGENGDDKNHQYMIGKRRRNRKFKNANKKAMTKEERQRRVELYTKMVEDGEALPVLPEFAKFFEGENDAD